MASRAHSCALSYFHVPMGVQFMVYGVAKGLPYKREVDEAILRLKETGLQRKMLHDFYPHPPECADLASQVIDSKPLEKMKCYLI